MVPVLSASPVTMSKIIEGRFRFPQKARLKFNHEILKQLSRIQNSGAIIYLDQGIALFINYRARFHYSNPSRIGFCNESEAILGNFVTKSSPLAFILGFERGRYRGLSCNESEAILGNFVTKSSPLAFILGFERGRYRGLS